MYSRWKVFSDLTYISPSFYFVVYGIISIEIFIFFCISLYFWLFYIMCVKNEAINQVCYSGQSCRGVKITYCPPSSQIFLMVWDPWKPIESLVEVNTSDWWQQALLVLWVQCTGDTQCYPNSMSTTKPFTKIPQKQSLFNQLGPLIVGPSPQSNHLKASTCHSQLMPLIALFFGLVDGSCCKLFSKPLTIPRQWMVI